MLTSTKLEQVTETQREFDPKAWFKNPDFQMLCAKKIEGQFYERKSTRDPERLAATICAFANSKPQGGLLAVGISDDGEIDGLLHRADVNLNEIANYRPFTGTQSHSKFVDCTNKHGKRDQILLIYVPYLENRVAETSKGKAYIRQGDKTIELRDSERRELEYSKGQKSFEDEKACVFSRDILSDDIIAEFRQGVARKDGASTDVLLEQVLQSKGLLKKDGDMLHLTKAAILFLGKDPCVHFPGAYIRFLRYSGTEKKTGQEQNLIKDEFFKEPLPRLIIRIKDFLKTQLRDFTYLGPDGKFVTEPEYPEPALLEAIVNAVVHRSYSQMNMCIHIEMYDDRIEIQSPGDYPPGVHPREFVHHARNHRLMDGMRLYCPERGYSRADYKAPYYQVKHFLLEAGFPSQMVDEETIANPSWKDYNLALDMFAKTGHVPWVLSEGLPNADLFLGLSYSSISGVGPSSRLMGYVNVFDRYGKWLFYRGNTEQIRFSDRNRAFRGLLESVAKEYAQRAKLQRVHVHHKFKALSTGPH